MEERIRPDRAKGIRRILRENVIVQYSLIVLLIVGGVSVALGITLARQISDFQFRSHIRLYPEIVNLAVQDNTQLYDVFDGKVPANGDTETLMRRFLGLGSIFRVKLWSNSATVLWSDASELIGQRFPDDDELLEAIGGELTYELGEAEKSENIAEKNKGITLQIYTPVFRDGKVAGVIELYEANRDLFAQIARSTQFVWALILGAGVVLYALLFLIFFRSYRKQKITEHELIATQDVTIFALAYQAELRDLQTGKHLERTAIYVRLLAEDLAGTPDFRGYLNRDYIEDLVKSAPLHDIGKVGVPDSILLKPGRLSDSEMAEMRKHCDYGAAILSRAASKLEFQSFLSMAIQLAQNHHERWDGKGYPKGLKGEEIPVSARIMAVADVYDALRTARVYKPAFEHEACLQEIRFLSGTHFDPRLVDSFLRCETRFRRVSEEMTD